AQMLREDFNGEGGFDIFCAMRPEEIARASYVKKPPSAPNLGPTNPVKELAFQKPWSAPGKVSQEQWMAAEIPASNMHANARALAGIVQPLANRGRTIGGETILSAAAIDGALAERIRGDDLVLPFHLAWCAGLMRNINKHFGPSETAYGHAGFGGSCVVVDPAHRLTAAYVMNRMSPHLVGDPRSIVLLDAVYAAL
ncbi:MAG TPA: serine hydrolase domain-containing protein, partial [Parvularculaceae bacterium]|nr:serine hydrolase domain-containing protein [Parvularculaceae bacterium]